MKILPLPLAASFGALFAGVAISQDRDNGKYSQVSQEIKTWFKHLTNKSCDPCCDSADGLLPDAWEIGPKHYRVKIYGEWLIVPNHAVINDPNRLGHAVVWLEPSWTLGESEGSDAVRCFLPGPQG